MRSTVAAGHDVVTRPEPAGNLEGEHRGHTLGRLRSTAPVSAAPLFLTVTRAAS